MARSPGFGSAATDSRGLAPASPGWDSVSLRLRDFDPLASPAAATRRLILQKARRHRGRPRLRPVVGPRFQVLFHSPRRGSFRLSLTVLLRYRSCSVFSLGSWSTRFPAGFLVPRRTQDAATARAGVSGTGLSPSRAGFPNAVPLPRAHGPRGPTTPAPWGRFGLLRFRSPLLPESLLISLPRLLRWFSSPGLPPRPMHSGADGGIAPAGLPHSATGGSKGVCPSPPLFAACRGLRRRNMPRHPPWTLFSLDHIAVPRPAPDPSGGGGRAPRG